MKGERRLYPSVLRLPKNATRVSKFAKKNKFTPSYVYKLYDAGRIKIVDFDGINFVIDKSIK